MYSYNVKKRVKMCEQRVLFFWCACRVLFVIYPCIIIPFMIMETSLSLMIMITWEEMVIQTHNTLEELFFLQLYTYIPIMCVCNKKLFHGGKSTTVAALRTAYRHQVCFFYNLYIKVFIYNSYCKDKTERIPSDLDPT